jgi:thioredoxin-like negative regulator of GroEL
LQDDKELLKVTTTSARSVVAFTKTDFERCRIVDRHLEELAKRYPTTTFCRINVQSAPFCTEKLQIRVLPAIVCFVGGVEIARIVGFEKLGNVASAV